MAENKPLDDNDETCDTTAELQELFAEEDRKEAAKKRDAVEKPGDADDDDAPDNLE